LGPPASGKGTQAKMIESRFQFPTVSTGALLREELERRTPLGLQADAYASKGGLVPDSLVLESIQNWLGVHNGKFICDGFPRTLAQGEAFKELLDQRETALEAVFFFDVSLEVVKSRVLNRVGCPSCRTIFGSRDGLTPGLTPCPVCGGELAKRKDDTLEALELRMQEYRAKTEPLISYYCNAGILYRLEASDDPKTVFSQITSVLEAA
jgi:adenylate kinase